MKKILFTIFVLSLLTVACSRLEEPTISWFLAIERGDIEQVERHIHWNTNINEAFENGNYPIHEAALKGRMILLEILIKNDANIDVKNRNNLTPLEVAILSGRTQAASLLIKSNSTFNPSKLILIAAKNGNKDKDVVKFLKSNKADFESTDKNGNTPLIIAVTQGNNRLAHHLIEYGSSINAIDKNGKTSLDIAEKMKDNELIKLLKRNGAINSKLAEE
tara:strand:- start:474 stop:1130 length:657 start_codon:yes stop_codon:yes gene_type:complete